MTTQLQSKNGRTVQEIIAFTLGTTVEELNPKSHLEREYDMDSLDNVELCMKLEVEFDIAISDEEWEKVHTVEQIEALVKSIVNGTQA